MELYRAGASVEDIVRKCADDTMRSIYAALREFHNPRFSSRGLVLGDVEQNVSDNVFELFDIAAMRLSNSTFRVIEPVLGEDVRTWRDLFCALYGDNSVSVVLYDHFRCVEHLVEIRDFSDASSAAEAWPGVHIIVDRWYSHD